MGRSKKQQYSPCHLTTPRELAKRGCMCWVPVAWLFTFSSPSSWSASIRFYRVTSNSVFLGKNQWWSLSFFDNVLNNLSFKSISKAFQRPYNLPRALSCAMVNINVQRCPTQHFAWIWSTFERTWARQWRINSCPFHRSVVFAISKSWKALIYTIETWEHDSQNCGLSSRQHFPKRKLFSK